MLTKRRTLASAALMLVAAIAFAALLAPVRALAEPNTVFTATATPSYSHPGTGVIEDSGGEASSALGQSMTESATFPAALVEYDANDTPFVTLRLQLMDHISDESISADTDWSGNFYGLGYNEMQNTGTTADFQVQEDPSAIFRIQMYVSDMGRYVIFYITLSDLVEGNTQGFVQSVDTSGGSEAASGSEATTDASGEAAAPAAASPTAASPAAATTAAAATTSAPKSTTTGQKVASATTAGTGAAASTADGIQEYDANGNPGGSGGSDGTITVPVIGLVTGIVAGLVIGIVAIAIAVGLGIWLYTIRNRNAIERANAALAAASLQTATSAQVAPAARQDVEPDQAGDAPTAEDGLDVTSVMPEPRPSKGANDGQA